MHLRFAILTLLVTSYLALPSLVHADLGAVVVTGTVAERDRKVASDAVESAGTAAGWVLKPLSKKEADAIIACTAQPKPWGCLPASVTKSVQKLIVTTIDPERADDGSVLLAVNVKILLSDSDSVAGDRRYCDHCTDDALAKTAGTLTTEILQELAVRAGRTVIAIKTTPAGAKIVLDGRAIGASDGAFNTFPGSHIVVLELAGFHSETRTIETFDGKTADLSVVMRASTSITKPISNPPRGPDQPPTTAPSRLVPGLVLTAGAILAIGGGVLFAVDEDPTPVGEQRRYRDTGPVGIGLAIGGAATVGLGVYLWLRQSTGAVTPASSSNSTPTITLVPSGGVIGWAGNF
ncbi:MAG: PEGA domain-containing protein [Deltaproteobacteria bacterium]|nr:PEGA domain-containing protein [Deltaproteobacteria bacterium]